MCRQPLGSNRMPSLPSCIQPTTSARHHASLPASDLRARSLLPHAPKSRHQNAAATQRRRRASDDSGVDQEQNGWAKRRSPHDSEVRFMSADRDHATVFMQTLDNTQSIYLWHFFDRRAVLLVDFEFFSCAFNDVKQEVNHYSICVGTLCFNGHPP